METNHIGLKIKELCQKKKISAVELSNMIGKSKQMIYAYFEKESIDTAVLFAISKALDVDIKEFFGGESSKVNNTDREREKFEMEKRIFELEKGELISKNLNEIINLIKDYQLVENTPFDKFFGLVNQKVRNENKNKQLDNEIIRLMVWERFVEIIKMLKKDSLLSARKFTEFYELCTKIIKDKDYVKQLFEQSNANFDLFMQNLVNKNKKIEFLLEIYNYNDIIYQAFSITIRQLPDAKDLSEFLNRCFDTLYCRKPFTGMIEEGFYTREYIKDVFLETIRLAKVEFPLAKWRKANQGKGILKEWSESEIKEPLIPLFTDNTINVIENIPL